MWDKGGNNSAMSLNSLSTSAVHSLKELFYDAYARSPAGEVTIGRAPNCTLTPSSHSADQQGTPLMLSRLHAKLSFSEGHLQLCDCGSVNGTWVNTQQLPQRSWKVLHDGDVLTFGGPPEYKQDGAFRPNPWRYVVKDLHEFLATFVPAARQLSHKNQQTQGVDVFRFNIGEGGEGRTHLASSTGGAPAAQWQQQDQTQEVFRFNNQAGTMRLEAVPSNRPENLSQRGCHEMQRGSSSEFFMPELSRSRTTLHSPQPSPHAVPSRPQHQRAAAAVGSAIPSHGAHLQHTGQASDRTGDQPFAQEDTAHQKDSGNSNFIDLTTDDSPSPSSRGQQVQRLLRRPSRPSNNVIYGQTIALVQSSADARQAADCIAESSPNKRREEEAVLEGTLYKRVKAGSSARGSPPEAVVVEEVAGPSTHQTTPHASARSTKLKEADAPGGEALAAVKSEFSCAICQEMLVHCVSMVPCGHMFCGECLAGWLSNKRDCPVCRSEATAPPISNSAVDNCTELLEKQLAPDDLQERLRKKQYWDENKKTLELALKSPWAGSSGDRTGIGSTRASRGHERSIRANGREDIMGAVFHMMLGGTGSQLFNDATYLDGVTQYHSVTGRAAINATQRRMFRVDYAPGRPSNLCFGCHLSITSNQLRIRVTESAAARTRWFHYSCVPQSMWSEMRINGVDNMRGISPADQAQLRTRQHAS